MTLICALAATLQLLSANALADPGGGWTWPVRGPVLTAYRNGDDPYAAGQHRGVDIGAPVGSRVVAAVGGTVTFAGVAGSSGLTVSERTADGRFDLSYLHLSATSVRRGETLAAGAALGSVGTSGHRSAEAPHLHFGVRDAGRRSAYRDPLDFLAPPPAGGAPDPAPAPVPVADPVSAEPAPAAAAPPSIPAGAAPAPLPLHGLPAPAPAPAPGHATPRVLATAVAPSHPVAPRHAAHGGGHRDRHANRRSGPVSTPRAAPSVARGPSTAAAPGAHPVAAAHGAHRSPGSHSGIDLGWLAACIGLIAVATALGHPDGARRVAERGRARLEALLRPAARQ
jgi:hypothetical protein